MDPGCCSVNYRVPLRKFAAFCKVLNKDTLVGTGDWSYPVGPIFVSIVDSLTHPPGRGVNGRFE
jgi:hypothetical protein